MEDHLDIVSFGKALIKSGDLDPLYILLWDAGMNREDLCRWLVTYWCYYHAGLCCSVIQSRDYWGTLLTIAKSDTAFPRGTERRHFRGKLAIDSIKKLHAYFDSPEEVVDWLLEAGPSATGIIRRVKTLHGFGEWISWKIPDMLEVLQLGKVVFNLSNLKHMFSSSKAGAEEAYSRHGLRGKDHLLAAHRYLLRKLGKLEAPPHYERRINVQETETVFCKWKSHLGGHYPIGKDTHEIGAGLARYEKAPLSRIMLKRLRKGIGGPINAY